MKINFRLYVSIALLVVISLIITACAQTSVAAPQPPPPTSTLTAKQIAIQAAQSTVEVVALAKDEIPQDGLRGRWTTVQHNAGKPYALMTFISGNTPAAVQFNSGLELIYEQNDIRLTFACDLSGFGKYCRDKQGNQVKSGSEVWRISFRANDRRYDLYISRIGDRWGEWKLYIPNN